MDVVYTASAISTGEGRDGQVRSSDGLFDVRLAVPKEMGGPGGATNPEQLFAAGYAGCFHSALRGVARSAGIDLAGSAVTADVSLGKGSSGGFGLQVSLEVELPEVEEATARDLLREAHAVCPYSNATRGNVDVTLNLA